MRIRGESVCSQSAGILSVESLAVGHRRRYGIQWYFSLNLLFTVISCLNLLWCRSSGSADRKIRIYDITAGGTGTLVKQIEAESQVSSLIWNPFERELLSSHGFSRNQLSLWKYPSMKKTHDLTGHTARILSTTLSPNGKMVCSAAADETLRFWDIFEEKQIVVPHLGGGSGSGSAAKNRKSNNSLNMRIR